MKKTIIFTIAIILNGAVFASEQPKYFLQSDDNDNFVCRDNSGIEGYNDEITVDEFLADPQRGECAVLISAYLNNVNLDGANLRGANLKGANLSEADMRDAYMLRSNLNKANLSGADLREAKLMEANMTGADLNDVKYNDNTILPFDEAEAKIRGMIKAQ